MKRCISIFIAACLLLALAACKNDPTPDAETSKTTKADEAPAAAVQLDVLLSLPNDSADLAAVASAYERATGTKLNLRSVPASGYDERLRAELKRDDAPALFELRSPKQYTDISAYCADLSKTSLYGFLSDNSLAITAGDGVRFVAVWFPVRQISRHHGRRRRLCHPVPCGGARTAGQQGSHRPLLRFDRPKNNLCVSR